jgi:hypothetical protein
MNNDPECLYPSLSFAMAQIISINCAHYPIRKNLMDYEEKFAGMITQIDKVNKMKIQLILFSLAYINNVSNYIKKLTLSHPNYNPSIQIKAGKLQCKQISQSG